jgi:putative membrane protein
MTDLLLAILHHLLVFTLAGILAAEWVLVRPGLSGAGIGLLARIDASFGGVAMAVILVGAGRVFFGLKGWEFYVFNTMFWAKMTAFVVVGLLSIVPTIRISGWRKAEADNGFAVPDAEVRSVRSFIKAEVAVFALIPVLAAAMARGVGY